MLSSKNPKNLSTKEILKLVNDKPLNTQIQSVSYPKNNISYSFSLPNEFKGQDVWSGLITTPVNQGSCGSCWAVASTTTLADRFNIQSKGKLNLKLSFAKMILCDFQGKEDSVKHPELHTFVIDKVNNKTTYTGECHGNTLYDAWRYLYLYGTCLSSCVPYTLKNNPNEYDKLSNGNDKNLPLCQNITGPLFDMCQNYSLTSSGEEYGTPMRVYRAKHFYGIANDEKSIRYEIFKWGPVSTGMNVYTDFYTFKPKTEIYSWNKKGDPVGGHAITIVGWGEEKNIKYWWIRNSWGKTWGINGYFKMLRGTNDCGIEENVLAPVVDFFYLKEIPSINLLWGETPDYIQTRNAIDIGSGANIIAGGIMPENGYTRRIKETKPFIDFKSPIDFDTDYLFSTSFIAGEITKSKRDFYFLFFIFILICILGYIFYKRYSYYLKDSIDLFKRRFILV